MAKGLQEELYQSPRFVQMNWCGEEVWEWEAWNVNPWPCSNTDNPRCVDGWAYTGQHHDWQREGNPVGYYAPGQLPRRKGNTLILASTVPPLEETKDISPNHRLISDCIYEVDWNNNILWEWHDHKHFDYDRDCGGRPGCLGMGFNEVEKKGISKFRAFIPNDEDASDYHHFNSASYLGPNKWWSWYKDRRFHPKNIIWDGRQSNITAIIAYDKNPDGSWEKGDIVWKIGPDYGPAQPEGNLGQIIGQHQAHMIPFPLPGHGNILLFDNGGMAGWGPFLPGMPEPVGYAPVPAFMSDFMGDEIHMGSKFRNYSRVIEFNPRTMKVVWEYKSLAPNNEYKINMFSGFISGAQRLKNGNTLITEGGPGRVFEVTKHGKIVWEFINRLTGPVAPPQGPGVGGPAIYRAYRVPYWWVPKYLLRKKCPEPVAAAE